MEPIRAFRGKTVALPVNNVDTDQITPAMLLGVDELGCTLGHAAAIEALEHARA